MRSKVSAKTLSALLLLWALLPSEGMAGFAKVMDYGLGHSANEATVSAAIFNGKGYLGTSNETKGCMVYRIEHAGSSWNTVEVSDWGFGIGVPQRNWTTAGIVVFDSRLYVGTWNMLDGANLWRTKPGVLMPQGQQDWERVDPASFLGFAVTSLEVFEGMLYAGIYTLTTGCRVWRSADGRNWAQVNRNGFGNDQNTDATTLAVFGDHLYVATENGHGSFGGTGTQVWRTDGNTPDPGNPGLLLWEKVNPADGFGTGKALENTLVMTAYDGHLFAGTLSLVLQAGSEWTEQRFPRGILGSATRKFYYHSAATMLNSLYVGTEDATLPGGRFLRYDGQQWYVLAEPGFGEPNVQGIGPILYLDGVLVAGTSTSGGGCSLWVSAVPGPDDPDNDSIASQGDNCFYVANPGQEDGDGDGWGDACDNCPSDHNPDQTDGDGDAYGVLCDCNDADPEENPGNPESPAAANCEDGRDNDCDGLTDGDDPSCFSPAPGPCSGDAEASVHGTEVRESPGAIEFPAILLPPLAMMAVFHRLRRNRTRKDHLLGLQEKGVRE
ncbi:MAG: putative metal-binding motif-containing protein [Thermodesulfobacteriota bacterium]